MAKLQIRNDSGSTIYLSEFGNQQIENNETLTISGSKDRFKEATELQSLIVSYDLVVIDNRGDALTAVQGERLRNGITDDEIQEQASFRVIVYGKKLTAGTLSKGDPIHITGYDEVTDECTFELADSDTIQFPSIGIVNGDVITDTQGGHVVIIGRITHMDTSMWGMGDSLYVSDTATLTNVRPVGIGNKVQKVAQVLSSHPTAGAIMVLGAGRANDIPNISEGKVWMGNNTDVGVETDVYTEAEIDSLLSGKSDTHTHPYLPTSQKGAANGVATLGADSKIPQAQLPAIAITQTSTAVSEVAQLALTVQEGDVCVRTDENKSYIALNADNADMGDWQELLTPTDAVQSVDGRSGVVTLGDLYATAAQGTLADSSTQPGDNVSTLMNDSGFITGYTVTQGDVTSHQAALSITKSQVSDFGSYATTAQGSLADSALQDINSESIKDLSDVLSSMTPTDGQVLTYDTTNGWQAETPSGGGSSSLAALTDTTITTPATNDTLVFNGSSWINATIQTGSASKVMNTWTLLSGNLYYNDFTHNLGTTEIVTALYDTTTKQQVRPQYITMTDANNIRVVVNGNSENLTCNTVTGKGPSGPTGPTGPAGADGTAGGGTLRLGHTWAISGEVNVPSGDTDFVLPFFVSLASGQTANMVKARYVINSGTSATVKLQKNGSDVAGWVGLSVTTTANSWSGSVPLADDDKLALVVTGVSGTPKNMTFTLFIEHTN